MNGKYYRCNQCQHRYFKMQIFNGMIKVSCRNCSHIETIKVNFSYYTTEPIPELA